MVVALLLLLFLETTSRTSKKKLTNEHTMSGQQNTPLSNLLEDEKTILVSEGVLLAAVNLGKHFAKLDALARIDALSEERHPHGRAHRRSSAIRIIVLKRAVVGLRGRCPAGCPTKDHLPHDCVVPAGVPDSGSLDFGLRFSRQPPLDTSFLADPDTPRRNITPRV
jgi:hypothetical protein